MGQRAARRGLEGQHGSIAATADSCRPGILATADAYAHAAALGAG